MKPASFQPWAERQFAASPAVGRVAGVQDERTENAHITYTHVTLATGATIVIHWVSTGPTAGSAPAGEPDPVVTGPPPAPVKVPELSTSGTLRTADIEAHLAALLNNGGHDEMLDVVGYTQDPQLGSADQKYGLRVRFHSGSNVYGLFQHTLPGSATPSQGTEFKQRDTL